MPLAVQIIWHRLRSKSSSGVIFAAGRDDNPNAGDEPDFLLYQSTEVRLIDVDSTDDTERCTTVLAC